ncbi:NUDIX domain-containing protein [Mesobacillus subterraneus]|uniref:NUDIX hydrolase n=1 Tax=Mesobacillus subterraneus TaxID=285983 RepID=A0A3R9FHY1_9BACI|nr:NUDIX hydrolase [Mesobacillus subterraneus]RSD28423.1 NUDIX hydrolase [Mesobacillus subterraneus]
MIRKAVGAIVFQGDRCLIVHKTNINTVNGKHRIKGEWDFIKGGIEESDRNTKETLLRELYEETGSREYKVIKEFEEKIHFSFPDHIKEKIGFEKQETTMFLVEFLGNADSLTPKDQEIDSIKLIEFDQVGEMLTHQDTKEFFKEWIEKQTKK